MAGFKGWKKDGYWLNNNNKDLIITISKLPFNTNCQSSFLSGFDRPIPGVLNLHWPILILLPPVLPTATIIGIFWKFGKTWPKKRKKQEATWVNQNNNKIHSEKKKWIHSCRNHCLRNWDKVKMQEKENNHSTSS